jgi:hypothetical protein
MRKMSRVAGLVSAFAIVASLPRQMEQNPDQEVEVPLKAAVKLGLSGMMMGR